jgi:hypothetical protein
LSAVVQAQSAQSKTARESRAAGIRQKAGNPVSPW